MFIQAHVNHFPVILELRFCETRIFGIVSISSLHLSCLKTRGSNLSQCQSALNPLRLSRPGTPFIDCHIFFGCGAGKQENILYFPKFVPWLVVLVKPNWLEPGLEMPTGEQWVKYLVQGQNYSFFGPCQFGNSIQQPFSYGPNALTTRLPATPRLVKKASVG
jgi:hypothetical protein